MQKSHFTVYEELIGSALDSYIIDGVLGIGGQAVVFESHDQTLRKKYAIKVFGLNRVDKSYLEKGLEEAKTQSQVDHPAVVKVYPPGIADVSFQSESLSVLYIPMDFSPNGSCEENPPYVGKLLEPNDIRNLISLLEGLNAIHEIMYHRDIKPANILRFPNHFPLRITDFGIAKEILAVGLPRGDSGLTPAYMAPEQINQEDSSAMDVYSMGATFYFLLTGEQPIKEPKDDPTDLYAWQEMHKTQIRSNPMDVNPLCPPRLALLIRRMMSVNKSERPTVAGCIKELEKIIENIDSKMLRFPLPEDVESQFKSSDYQIRYTPSFNEIFAPAVHILCGTKFYVVRMQMNHPIFSQYKMLIDLMIQAYSDCFSLYETYGPYDIHIFLWSDEERIKELESKLKGFFIGSLIEIYLASSNIIHLHDEEYHRGDRTILGTLAVQERIQLPEIDPQSYLLAKPYPTDEPEHSIRAFTYVNAVSRGRSFDFSFVQAAIIHNVKSVLDDLMTTEDNSHSSFKRKRFPRLSMITFENTKGTDEPVAVINFVASDYKYIHQVATDIIERGSSNAVKTSTFLETGRIIIQSDKILF